MRGCCLWYGLNLRWALDLVNEPWAWRRVGPNLDARLTLLSSMYQCAIRLIAYDTKPCAPNHSPSNRNDSLQALGQALHLLRRRWDCLAFLFAGSCLVGFIINAGCTQKFSDCGRVEMVVGLKLVTGHNGWPWLYANPICLERSEVAGGSPQTGPASRAPPAN
jgi:hypothetical protein